MVTTNMAPDGLEIEVTESLILDGGEAAIAALARIGHDDVVERALLGAAAGEANFQRHFRFSFLRIDEVTVVQEPVSQAQLR